MSKPTVTRIFIGSLLAILAGAILGAIAIAIAIANDVFVLSGTDIVAIESSVLSWTLVGAGLIAGAVILAGMVGGVVAWIGALLNSSQLESKRWFIALVVLGILSVGLLAMIAWLLAGPDGTAGRTGSRSQIGPIPTPASLG